MEEKKIENEKMKEKTEVTEKKEVEKINDKKIKKEDAKVSGLDLQMSTKVAVDICSMIRRRHIDSAIKMIEEVITLKRPVKMNKREVPHRHGKNMMAGRYPIKAAGDFLRLLKQLKANALHNELEVEKFVIWCKADKASQHYKRGGRKAKRSHVFLKLEKGGKK
jgi:large subunit ribosomal protein L22